MRDIWRTVMIGSACLAAAACTSFESKRAIGAKNASDGIWVADQIPLLVVSNGEASTVLVPSPDRGMALNFSTFLAKNDVTLKFANGVLTELSSTQDSTAVPVAALGTVNEAIKNAKELATAFSGGDSGFQVYRINFTADGMIDGLTPLINEGDLRALRPVAAAGTTGVEPINPDGSVGDAKEPQAPPKQTPDNTTRKLSQR